MKLKHNIFLYSTFAFLSCVVYGCNDFLSEEPYTKYSVNKAFDTVEKLSSATLGIYEVLSTQDLYGKNIPLLEATSDIEINKANKINSNINDVGQISNFNIIPSNSQIETLWKQFYASINRANLVIANYKLTVTESDLDKSKVNMYLAEAKVLRAFVYFELIKRWGDVPFVTEPASVTDLFHERVDKFKIYDSIISDIETSIPSLPWYNEELYEKGRMHKGAAMGLLSRICLFAGSYYLDNDGVMKRHEKYKDYLKKVDLVTEELISSNVHALNPDYENIFYKVCQNELEPSETMFEIGMAYLNGASKHASTIGANGSIGVPVKKHSNTYNCNPKVYTHQYARSKFADEDKRRDISIADYVLTGVDFNHEPVTDKGSFTFAKWRRDWHKAVPQNWACSDVNNVILRYSDIYLMRAEVLNELDESGSVNTEAVELVNKVRRRGYGFDINTPNPISDVPNEFLTDKETFFKFLTDEYAREFTGEGGRRFHLIRWNILKDKIKEMSDLFDDSSQRESLFGKIKVFLPKQTYVHGKHELYPIPYREIVESKGLLSNNPNYD